MKRFILGTLAGLLVFPAIAFVWGILGLFSIRATDQPSYFETRVARATMVQSLKHSAKQKNPADVNDQYLLDGMKIFRNACAGCHGDFSKASHWGTADFYPRVPQFADEPPTIPASQMFVVVKHGIRYTGMGAWDGEMSDEDIWKVVTFLNNLATLPPSVRSQWQTAAN